MKQRMLGAVKKLLFFSQPQIFARKRAKLKSFSGLTKEGNLFIIRTGLRKIAARGKLQGDERMKKGGKRMWLCLLLCAALQTAAFAGESAYDLAELGVRITLPEDMMVFTRETRADDASLRECGISWEALLDYMIRENVYWIAHSEDLECSIVISMTDNCPYADFHRVSDAYLRVLMAVEEGTGAEADGVYGEAEIYRHAQTKFVKAPFRENADESLQGLRYRTVREGRTISVSLYSRAGGVDSAQAALLKSVIDGMAFFPGSVETPGLMEEFGRLYTWRDLLISLALTIAVYSLPIMVYRYAIRRRPVGAEKAKKIAMGYGVFAFLAMTALLRHWNGSGAAGGAILLWSWVNYRALIGGRKRKGNERQSSTMGR